MKKVLGENITIRVRVWIDTDEKPFLGWGRVKLLEQIKETGSISKAAKVLKMSYRQAWEHVRNMNDNASQPLVITLSGGKDGGGAQLTSFGKSAITTFKNLEKEINNFAQKV